MRCSRPMAAALLRGLTSGSVILAAQSATSDSVGRRFVPSVRAAQRAELIDVGPTWFESHIAVRLALGLRGPSVQKQRAEREGFEPSVPFRIHMISNHAPSATRSPLRAHGEQHIRYCAPWLCGESGSRTHGTLSDTPDFESGTFGHSVISPRGTLSAPISAVNEPARAITDFSGLGSWLLGKVGGYPRGVASCSARVGHTLEE